MERVLFISAGQQRTKKGKSVSNNKNMYLNYGLLSLATVISNAGYHPVVAHGNFTAPDRFIDELAESGLLKTRHPLYISIPSFYALSWVNEFTSLLKSKMSNIIYVGGRWVIDDQPEALHKELPYVDHIITGLGENKILKTLTGMDDINNYDYIALDYSLLKDRHLYQPSIEVSRGCGKKCAFCQEKNEPLTTLKNPSLLIKEYQDLIINDDLRIMTPYFEASMFKPTEKWLEDLINARHETQQLFSWRAESRVDSLTDRLIHMLAQAGMKVIDLGLESASPEQLLSMEKSPKPDSYLERASRLLQLCYQYGIKTKVNVMFYAGENEKTINETTSWLREHQQYIYGLSSGVVSAFGWDNTKRAFIESLQLKGASICETESFTGVTNFNLSKELSYQEGIHEAKKLSREFMSIDNFFYLKSFSYYPRDYSLENFKHDINQEQGDYSFSC